MTSEHPGLSQSAAWPPAGADIAICLWRHYGWSKELFFKELKGTLGLHRYRLREFRKVEGWAQACLVAFCYLEWYRAGQLGRRDLPEKERRWWEWQRSYGLGLAICQRAEDHDLGKLLRWSGTKAGLKRLRQALRQAQPREYRPAG